MRDACHTDDGRIVRTLNGTREYLSYARIAGDSVLCSDWSPRVEDAVTFDDGRAATLAHSLRLSR